MKFLQFCHRMLPRNSKGFLSLFIALILMMISISFVIRGDPRVKVFVIGTKQTVSDLVLTIEKVDNKHSLNGNILVYTLEDEWNDLPVLAQTKFISAFIIADQPYSKESNSRFIVKAAFSVPRIIILREYLEPRSLADILYHAFPEKTVVVSSREELASILRRVPLPVARTALPYDLFKSFVKVIGILSLLAVLFGVALTTCVALELGEVDGTAAVIDFLPIPFFVFVITQFAYITVSAAIGIPVGLHYTRSSITVMSFLGPFGGGNTLRSIVSFFGFSLGICMKYKSLRIHNKIVSCMFFLILFVIFWQTKAKPIGSYLYVALKELNAEVYWRDFSRGICFFFMGSISLITVYELRKYTQAFLISYSMLLICWGISRVGNMMLYQTLDSTISGLFLSFSLIFMVRLLSYIESFVSLRFNFKHPNDRRNQRDAKTHHSPRIVPRKKQTKSTIQEEGDRNTKPK